MQSITLPKVNTSPGVTKRFEEFWQLTADSLGILYDRVICITTAVWSNSPTSPKNEYTFWACNSVDWSTLVVFKSSEDLLEFIHWLMIGAPK